MKQLLTLCELPFNWTWTTSLQAALLVVLVLLVHKLLGRWLTPRLRYALSFLILCRLLLPVAPPSHTSVKYVTEKDEARGEAKAIFRITEAP